ncbi:MAG TPA: ParB/RepB/Spo0J family partition protein [Gaiellaceae bacterium]|nr:ParB/RepB/Spo0J family partition protein [Gaiellaceae bacterium]
MAAIVTMVPLAKIKARAGFNPRSEFADEQMAELVESVRRHGIITPLTLAADGDGFVIVAGERRYRAAKQAKLKDVPAQVRDGDGDALALAVAENVIRADLNPVEEARAYERLVNEQGSAAKVAKLVGRSDKLIADRLALLRLPEEAQALLAARRVPLACAPALIQIAEREPLLADLSAAWLAERPKAAAGFPGDPGEVVDAVLEAEWQDDDGRALVPVAYSVGGWYGPLLPGGRTRDDLLPRILRKLGEHGEAVQRAHAELPAILCEDEYDWQARQVEERRERECFALTDEDADAARAFGCLLELPDPDGRGDHRYVTDPQWLADRLVQKTAAHAAAEAERREHEREARRPTAPKDEAEKEARRQERERQYEARVAARARNLDLGSALARWQPKVDTDAVKLLGSLVLLQYGKAAAWAHRLCVEQPTTANKQGKVTVRYPRGAQAEKELHDEATARLMRARTPEDALAVVLRLLLAQRLVDTEGLPGADRQGVYEPQELAGSKVLAKLARRVAPPSVKRHLAEQEAERERREREWREQQAAKLSEHRAKLEAGEPVRCACCFEPITSPEASAERHGSLVHKGDCEEQWGSAYDENGDPAEEEAER